MTLKSVRRAVMLLFVLGGLGALGGCGKTEVNEASPPLSTSETSRNEPPPKLDDGTRVAPATNPGEPATPSGPGEIVGRDRPTAPGGN